MVSYLGTPPVATFEIEGSVVGKYVISGKCRHSPICLVLYFDADMPLTSSFSMVLDSFG